MQAAMVCSRWACRRMVPREGVIEHKLDGLRPPVRSSGWRDDGSPGSQRAVELLVVEEVTKSGATEQGGVPDGEGYRGALDP